MQETESLEVLGFSPDEFSKRAGIGKTLVYEHIKSGQLVARKVGTRTLILAEDANKWLRSLPTVKERNDLRSSGKSARNTAA